MFPTTRKEVQSFRSFSYLLLILIMLSLLPLKQASAVQEPEALILTWQQDPTTTMTIDWHVVPGDQMVPIVRYKKAGDQNWNIVPAYRHDFPFSQREILRSELTRLEPGTYYRFRVGEFGREYKFRTMPANLNEPVSFITGGDTFGGEIESYRHQMTEQAMTYDPEFILWGGDLAYANADPYRTELWYNWFDAIMEYLVSDEGRVVPIVVAIGNHEVFGIRRLLGGSTPHHEHTQEEAEAFMERYGMYEGKATYFPHLFAFPGREKPYNVLDFSDYMSLVVLDSDHVAPVEGEQTEWLRGVMAERGDRPHIFPIYHWPAYPSHRPYSGSTPTRIRENWVPLFQEHGVRVVFENHDHTYKRTHPIWDDEISPRGLVYIGDGNWGRSTSREGNSRDEWYINQFLSQTRHGIIVTLHGTHQHFLMVDDEGNVFDEYPRTPEIQR